MAATIATDQAHRLGRADWRGAGIGAALQKNDFRDAEAITEAVQRPTMKFVATKTAEQLLCGKRNPIWQVVEWVSGVHRNKSDAVRFVGSGAVASNVRFAPIAAESMRRKNPPLR
jgi:hypothetical protein